LVITMPPPAALRIGGTRSLVRSAPMGYRLDGMTM